MTTGAVAGRCQPRSMFRAPRSPALAVFVVALTLRLVVLAVAVFGPGRVLWLPDSLEYDLLGRNLALHGVFSRSPAPPFAPDYQRTPLFPLQVTLAYLLAGGRPGVAATLTVAANAVLGALTAALLVPLGAVLGARRAGLWAGLLLAVDLTSIVYSAMLLSEELFALLLVGALLALARYAGAPGAWPAALAGAALGLATLTRPIGILLPLVFAPCFFLAQGRRGLPSALRDLALCGLVMGAIVAPWSLRARAAGVDDATATQAAINAYFHRGVLIEAARTGRDPEDVRAELEAAFEREAADGGWSERQRVEVMRERAARLIEGHRLLYLRLQLRGMLQLLGPETDALFDLAGLRRPADAPHEGPSRPVRETWRLLGMGQLALVYALAARGALALVRDRAPRRWAILALLALPLAYFVVVSGPEAYARFRVPAMPEVVLLAAVADCWPRAAQAGAKKPGE